MGMDDGLAARVTGVSAMLFIPLFSRTSESRRPDSVLRDPAAVALD